MMRVKVLLFYMNTDIMCFSNAGDLSSALLFSVLLHLATNAFS